MFGALVLGGSMLVQPPEAEAEPESKELKGKPDQGSQAQQKPPVKAKSVPAPPPPARLTTSEINQPRAAKRSAQHCQMEFTLHKYSRDGVELIPTCLDDKSDAEILKVIHEAKKQTCMSPFCGCWLG